MIAAGGSVLVNFHGNKVVALYKRIGSICVEENLII